jgi:hypothetical protein
MVPHAFGGVRLGAGAEHGDRTVGAAALDV